MKITWFAGIILLEQICAVALFAIHYEKRKLFWLRAAIAFLVNFWIVVLMPTQQAAPSWYKFLSFLLYFILLVLSVFFAFQISLTQATFACIAGYASQHFVNNLIQLIGVFVPLSSIIPNTVLRQSFELLVFYLPCYVAIYFLYARHMKNPEYEKPYALRMKIISAVILPVCIGISRFAKDHARDDMTIIAESLYAMVCCNFALVIQFSLLRESKMVREDAIIRQLWHDERRQYEQQKSDMELINIKCHDIRHKIAEFSSKLTEEEINSLKQTISIYDSAVKTGNKTLDVILTKKSLLCKKEEIKLTCMGDGASLDFLSESELYSLLENALDNAIEAVRKLPKEKRQISLLIRSIGDVVTVGTTNYYDSHLIFTDGLPLTTSENEAGYHGFGMLSMRRIADRYGGELSVKAENGIFELNLYLVKPEKTAVL